MRLLFYIVLACLCLDSSAALAFMAEEGCGAGSCTDCHALSMEEARDIFKDIEGEIASVDFAAVPGLWRIDLQTHGQTIPIYLDFSKTYLITGNVIRLTDRKNLTEERLHTLNPVDLTQIPSEDALLMGNPDATERIFVFTDPRCPYCSKLHQVIKQAIEQRNDLLFLIKLVPVKEGSLPIARTIHCNRSLEQLDEAFAGHSLPEATCESDIVEQNLELSRNLRIRSTPTLVLPNGRIAPGYKELNSLLELIDQNPARAKESVKTAADKP